MVTVYVHRQTDIWEQRKLVTDIKVPDGYTKEKWLNLKTQTSKCIPKSFEIPSTIYTEPYRVIQWNWTQEGYMQQSNDEKG